MHLHSRLLPRPVMTLIVTVLLIASLALPASARWVHKSQAQHLRSEPSEFTIQFPTDVRQTHFFSSFGARRSGGRRHLGNDLMAPKMTSVFAAADGVVVDLGWGPRSGYYLVLEHDDGWTSWYIHLNNDTPGTDDGEAREVDIFAAGIEVDVSVTAGQLIGYAGDSGNAEHTAPHTHFELHHDGRPVNPYRYLLDAYRRELAILQVETLNSVTQNLELQLSDDLASSSATRWAILSMLLPTDTTSGT